MFISTSSHGVPAVQAPVYVVTTETITHYNECININVRPAVVENQATFPDQSDSSRQQRCAISKARARDRALENESSQNTAEGSAKRTH